MIHSVVRAVGTLLVCYSLSRIVDIPVEPHGEAEPIVLHLPSNSRPNPFRPNRVTIRILSRFLTPSFNLVRLSVAIFLRESDPRSYWPGRLFEMEQCGAALLATEPYYADAYPIDNPVFTATSFSLLSLSTFPNG